MKMKLSTPNRPQHGHLPMTGALAGWFTLAVLLLLAACLRLPSLGADSLWNNEILSFQRATQETLAESYQLIKQGTHPPLYSLGVLRPLSVFGLDERLQRLPSVLFGLLTIAVVFVFCNRAFSRQVAVYAALLLSIAPVHVYYSREGRMYALLALLCTLWVSCLSRALQHGRWASWFGFSLFAAASLYTHYYAGLTLAAVVLACLVLLVYQARWSCLRSLISANAAIVALFAPWLPTLWYQLHNEPVSHLATLSLRDLLSMPVQFFTGFELVPMPVKVVTAVAVLVLGLSALLSLWRPLPARKEWRQDLLLVFAAFVGTLFLAAMISLVKPILFLRYLTGVIPFACIVLAVGANHLRPRPVALSMLAIPVLVGLACSVLQLQQSWRPNFKEPLRIIEQHARPNGHLLLLAPSADSFHLLGFEHYYRGTIPVTRLYNEGANATQLQRALNGLAPATEYVWVLQVQTVKRLPERAGAFNRVYQAVFPSRFFYANLPIKLARYERADTRENGPQSSP